MKTNTQDQLLIAFFKVPFPCVKSNHNGTTAVSKYPNHHFTNNSYLQHMHLFQVHGLLGFVLWVKYFNNLS